jgi:hypothetical protein
LWAMDVSILSRPAGHGHVRPTACVILASSAVHAWARCAVEKYVRGAMPIFFISSCI